MSDDDLEFLAAKARMRQYYEWARRERDLVRAKKAVGDRPTAERPEAGARWSLSRLIRVFATRGWVRAARRRPIQQDT